ncbi:MAG: OmpA family protein [Bacteroidales bacterium]
MDILNGNIFIGAPIHFFFKIGTTNLTDESQMINLDELARVAKQHSLKITVVGAADSSTGTSSINDSLGKSRAEFILNNLIERGVEINHITSKSKGGIDNYTPTAANRNTMVYLYF